MLFKQTLPLDQLKSGQVLAEHALKGGAIILPKGTALDSEAIKLLNQWRIPAIAVFSKEPAPAATAPESAGGTAPEPSKQVLATDQLKPGQVMAEDILSGGAVIVPKGTTIDEKVIQSLNQWRIFEVSIFATEHAMADAAPAPAEAGSPQPAATAPRPFPAGPPAAAPGIPVDNYQDLDPRQLLSPADREKSAAYPPAIVNETAGELVITGTVGIGHGNISTKLPLRIEGSVAGGVTIHSQDSITVSGDIYGACLKCSGLVTARNVRQSVIITFSSAQFDSVTNSVIDARERITVTTGSGTILGGRLLSGGEILAKRIGNIERQPTEFVINGNASKIRYQSLLDTETAVAALQREVSQLKKVIDLIQMLGQQVTALPPEKRQQLKQQSDLYFARKKKLDEALGQKEYLELALAASSASDYCPVRVYEVAYAGVRVTIDGAVFALDKINNNIGFHKKTMVLIRLFR